jgi:hypothetical protein
MMTVAHRLTKEISMENKSVLGLLFDLSFTEFVTTRVIQVVFVVGIVFSAVGTLTLIATAFNAGTVPGVLVLIVSPLFFLLYVLAVRIWCEIIIVVFRIAENTGRLVERDRS